MEETTESVLTYKPFHFGYVSNKSVRNPLKNDDLPPGLLKDSVVVISAPLLHIMNL